MFFNFEFSISGYLLTTGRQLGKKKNQGVNFPGLLDMLYQLTTGRQLATGWIVQLAWASPENRPTQKIGHPRQTYGSHPFVRKFTGFWQVHGKNWEKSGDLFDLSLFFPGFSGPDFAKISAAVLRIFLVRSTAPETNIWPISSFDSVFFRFCWPQHVKIQLSPFSF